MMTDREPTDEMLPYAEQKIPVSNGLDEFQSFVEQYPGFTICPYIADKNQESWDSSTSRVYMNQVLPGFMYIPVNIPKDDQEGLHEFLEAVRDAEHIAAVNITQPHKSSPVLRKMFLGDENSNGNVDTLIRNPEGTLEPYDLNAPAFVEWYTNEVGSFAGKTIVLVGVGGVGEPMAKAMAKQAPAQLILVDPNDKEYLVDQLRDTVPVSYHASISALPEVDQSGNMILINAAGKEGATDNSAVAELLGRYAHSSNVFVDIRPQLEIEIVEAAKDLGWQAHTGYGMNARNDYVLLSGIAKYAGTTPPSFEEFQKFVAAAS
jgi:shikimate dehydrogenase